MLRLGLHAMQAPQHQMGYESDLTPAPGLLFVHDQGVYLMSNGRPADTDDSKPSGSSYVVYAAGCNPHDEQCDDWYETSRDLVGGDDFVEVLPLEDMQQFMTNCTQYDEFVVEVTSNNLSAFFRKPKARISTRQTAAV